MDKLPEDILLLFPDYNQNYWEKFIFANSLLLCCKYFLEIYSKKMAIYFTGFKLDYKKIKNKLTRTNRILSDQFIWTITKKSVILESKKYLPPVKLIYLALLYNKIDLAKYLIRYYENNKSQNYIIYSHKDHILYQTYLGIIPILIGYSGDLELVNLISPGWDHYIGYGYLMGGHTNLIQNLIQHIDMISDRPFIKFYNSNPANKILKIIPYTDQTNNIYQNPYPEDIDFDIFLFRAEINKKPINFINHQIIKFLIIRNYNFLLKNIIINSETNNLPSLGIDYRIILNTCNIYHNYYAYKIIIKYTNIDPVLYKSLIINKDIMIFEHILKYYTIPTNQNTKIINKQKKLLEYISPIIFVITIGLLSAIIIK